jgi:Tol biopolymer transport system component
VRLAVFCSAAASVILIARLGPGSAELAKTPIVFESDTLEVQSADLSPDGASLLITAGAGRGDLWIWRTKDRTLTRVGPMRDIAASAAWFPTGDRIAYLDLATSELRTLVLDQVTGRVSGQPRTVARDTAMDFEIAPDGRSIIYSVRGKPGRSFHLVADSGGSPRILASYNGVITPASFGANSRDIYFDVAQSAGEPPGHVMYRLPVDGGSPVPFTDRTPTGRVVGRSLYARKNLVTERRPQAQAVLILTLQNDTLFRIDSVRTTDNYRLSADGTSLLVWSDRSRSRMTLFPLDGRAASTIGAFSKYQVPLSWTSGADFIYLDQPSDPSANAVIEASADGKRRREVPIPLSTVLRAEAPLNEFIANTRDGRYWLLRVSPGEVAIRNRFDQPGVKLYGFDRSTGATRLLSEQYANRGIVQATPDRGLAFFEHRADSVRLRLWRPDGAVETLRTFAAPDVRGAHVALHGDRVAWSSVSSDSSRLHVARRQEPEQTVATVLGAIEEIAWSPNGHWIAALIRTMDRKSCIQLLSVDARGRAELARQECVTEGRALQWTPTSDGVMVWENLSAASQNDVRFVPVDSSKASRVVTPQGFTFDSYLLSPDGRTIAASVRSRAGSVVHQVRIVP